MNAREAECPIITRGSNFKHRQKGLLTLWLLGALDGNLHVSQDLLLFFAHQSWIDFRKRFFAKKN
jgi:hypothetical protein